MEDDAEDLNQFIAARVAGLRADRGLSLDALAEGSGVSRSMISLIERGESNPTAVVLHKLAQALGVTTASFFDPLDAPQPSPLCRRAEQRQWRDPESAYLRRNLSPPGIPQPVQLVEVLFPGGERVTFDSHSGESALYEQIWMLDGQMELTVGAATWRLHPGDCLATRLGEPIVFHNPLKKTARYLVAVGRMNGAGR